MANFPAVSIILVDTRYVENIFPTAAAYRKLSGGDAPCLILSASPETLGDEKALQGRIAQEISNYAYDNMIDADMDTDDEDEDLPLIHRIDKIRFYLINIGPRQSSDVERLMSFIDLHSDDIVWWVDSNHDWLPDEKMYVNLNRKIIYNDRLRSALSVLEDFKIHSPKTWKRAEDALLTASPAKMAASTLGTRFCDAFFVGKIISDNIDDPHYLYFCFIAMMNELVRKQIDPHVDSLLNNFLKCFYSPDEAKKRISLKSPYFRRARKMGRTVACLNLGQVSSFQFIPKILQEGERDYPWLFVLRYQIGQKPKLFVRSRVIDVDHIMKSYAGFNYNHGQLMKILNAEVVTWGQKRA